MSNANSGNLSAEDTWFADNGYFFNDTSQVDKARFYCSRRLKPLLCELCNQHPASEPSFHVWLITSQRYAERLVALDSRVTDKHLFLFPNTSPVKNQHKHTNNYTWENDECIKLKNLQTFSIFLPLRCQQAGSGRLAGDRSQIGPAALIQNTALWPTVKKSLCGKETRFCK